ncbi:MAG: hypothetical protein HYS39_02095 [Proteobacteria bacterium]|nr:hypothetical protein [Pseudomonadota bacterium]
MFTKEITFYSYLSIIILILSKSGLTLDVDLSDVNDAVKMLHERYSFQNRLDFSQEEDRVIAEELIHFLAGYEREDDDDVMENKMADRTANPSEMKVMFEKVIQLGRAKGCTVGFLEKFLYNVQKYESKEELERLGKFKKTVFEHRIICFSIGVCTYALSTEQLLPDLLDDSFYQRFKLFRKTDLLHSSIQVMPHTDSLFFKVYNYVMGSPYKSKEDYSLAANKWLKLKEETSQTKPSVTVQEPIKTKLESKPESSIEPTKAVEVEIIKPNTEITKAVEEVTSEVKKECRAATSEMNGHLNGYKQKQVDHGSNYMDNYFGEGHKYPAENQWDPFKGSGK